MSYRFDRRPIWTALIGTAATVVMLAGVSDAAAAPCKSGPACALAARTGAHVPAALGAAAGSAVGHVLAAKQQHQPPHKPFRTYQLPPRAALTGS